MTEVTLKIIKASVLYGNGTDKIYIEIEAPTQFPALGYPAAIKVETAHGYGVEWVKEVFGVDAEIIYTTQTERLIHEQSHST